MKIRELQHRQVSLHRDLYLMEEFLRNCLNCSHIKNMLAREKDENIMQDAILFGIKCVNLSIEFARETLIQFVLIL